MLVLFLLLFIAFLLLGGVAALFLNKVYITMKKDSNKAEIDIQKDNNKAEIERGLGNVYYENVKEDLRKRKY